MSAPPSPVDLPGSTASKAPADPRDQVDPARPDDLIGLVPAAGVARRLGPLPCSKELLPIAVADGQDVPVQVVAERLLAAFGRAGVERAILVIDRDKMDIPRHFARRTDPSRRSRSAEPALAFVAVTDSPSVPHSLAAALPFLGDSPAALGFPDVLFTPEDAFARVDDHRRRSGAPLVLGLFPAPDPTSTDMVEIADDGRVQRIEIRPRRTRLCLNWLIAVWDRRFTAWLGHRMAAAGSTAASELQLGTLFAEALADGLPIEAVPFPDGSYLDVGTPAGYARALAAGALLPTDSPD